MLDYLLNGRAYGGVAEALAADNFDTGLRRPFFNERGIPCVTLKTGRKTHRKKKDGSLICNSDGTPFQFDELETVRISDLARRGLFSPVFNATTLRKLEWVTLDNIVLTAARKRLKAWIDLAARNPVSGFDGFGTMVYEYETQSDEGEAVVDMDALTQERQSGTQYQLQGTPLPITHAGFFLSRRLLTISRKNNTPLDFVRGEQAGRRIGEKIEQTLIGSIAGVTYGDASQYGRAPTVYGYTNFPNRITKTNMAVPTGSNGPAVLSSWLAMRDLMYANNFFGPFMVYTSNDYDQYLDNVFTTTQASMGTLRQQLKMIDGVEDIKRLDYLANTFTTLWVQMTPDVARAIIGMPITNVQWEEAGGYMLKFRSLTIQVPQLRADFYGRCGIGHGTTA